MDEKYTPFQFVKDWIPDYKDRIRSGEQDEDFEQNIVDALFKEAVEAFADAQREECQIILNQTWEEGNNNDMEDVYERFRFMYYNDVLMFAPTPKPNKNEKS